MVDRENKTFRDFEDFRAWLEKNHTSESEARLYIFKKASKEVGIGYEDAVLAGLCYGWIDSVKHSYDENKYLLRFTPRKKNSNWSLSNIKRVKRLIEDQQMTEHGLKFFNMDLIDQLPILIEQDKLAKEARKK